MKAKMGNTRFIKPSDYISDKVVKASLNALHKVAKTSKQKNKMFEDDTSIFLQFNCIKIPSNKGKVSIVLPHSTVASTGEVCLITPDLKKGKKPDHEPTIDHWEEMLRKADVTNVKTVLPMRQLRVEYDQYELKRRLMTQHDYIMVDTRVLKHVTHLLGIKFLKKPNMLIPVRIKEDNIKKCIDIGYRTTLLRFNEGATATMIVGHMGMPIHHIQKNITAVVKALNGKFPGGEANIRSIFVKLPLSIALPLYITLRPSDTLNVPKLHHTKPKLIDDVEDEWLSTVPGARVRVSADGTVRIIHKKASKPESDIEKDDEEQMDEEESESEQSVE